MSNGSVDFSNSDEIDLKRVFCVLWQQKKLIACIMFVAVFLSACYAFFAAPLYEAKVYVVPPTQDDISNLNYGRTSESELPYFTVKEIYSTFLFNLQSESVRRSFFNDIYLPSLDVARRKRSEAALYNEFTKRLVISSPGKDLAERYQVVMQGDSPAESAELLDKFVIRAGEAAKRELIKNITREAEVRAMNLAQQIAAVREGGQQKRADYIVQLKEALQVASEIGLLDSPSVSGKLFVEVSNSRETPLYMRGAKALRAEIQALENRKSDDPFIISLRGQEAKYDLYRSLMSFAPLGVEVYRMDGAISQIEDPIKPRKAMVILAGLMLGLFFGGVYALGRDFLRAS
ncbi:LPS O-antigen chain length determinant protein WzzB [Pseudomonas sp. NPDC089530]|uniref:LPS O-antigen chain length determinant protein WzzB n=1 Tax=Pseudomonas sp. NPDC089530 TaxID=3390651 RepID=UPI003CFC1E48